MRVLIDGYNYLHAVGLLLPRSASHAGPHELERARLALLGQLATAFGAEETVTVVFDAQGAPPTVRTEDWHQHIHIYNERCGSADDRIEDLIRHDSAPKGLTVVSDDRRLRDAAARRGCSVLGCSNFTTAMERHRCERLALARPITEKPEAVSDREREELERAFGSADSDDPAWPDWERE